MSLEALRTAVEGKIEFQGQRLADRINQETIILLAVIAFIVGWAADNIILTMIIYAFGVAVALVVCVPPWPMYKRHPVHWLPNRPSSTGEVAK